MHIGAYTHYNKICTFKKTSVYIIITTPTTTTTTPPPPPSSSSSIIFCYRVGFLTSFIYLSLSSAVDLKKIECNIAIIICRIM